MNPRLPLHTVLGCFATLLVTIPMKLAQGAGFTEDGAMQLAGLCLLVLAVLAFVLHRRRWVQARGFHVAALRQRFELSQFLRAFAMFAAVELVVITGLWFALRGV